MMKIDLYLMAVLYLAAGINHFINPKFYKRIIPPLFGNKDLVNFLSGGAEIILAVLLLTPLQTWAAWGLIALLIAVFPANVYHVMLKGAGMRIPVWALWVRLPIQFILIWWAWQYV